MRALGTALLGWLVAGAASAQWTVVDVPGTPADVEFTGAGVAAVATSSGAHFLSGTGGAFSVDAGPTGTMVSAYRDGTCGCGTNELGAVTCCTTTKQITPPFGNDAMLRVQHSDTGARYLAFVNDGNESVFGYSPAPFVDTYEVVAPCGTVTSAIDALTVGQDDWGLMALGGCGMVLMNDGVVARIEGYGDHGLGTVNEVALYAQADGGLGALLAHGAGVARVEFLDGGAAATPVAAVSTIPAANVTGIAYAHGTGDAYGDGFGMAIVAGTEDRFFGPIPDPANPGVTWIERTPQQVTLVQPLQRVTCHGARACVALAPTTSSNLLVYENLSPPTVTLPTVTIDETELQAVLEAFPADTDGDPTFVRWFPDAGSGLEVTVLNAAGTQAQVTRPAGQQVCGDGLDFAVRVSASDGRAGHVGFADGILHVNHTVPPGAPIPSGPERIAAGAASVLLRADPALGSCPLVDGISWTPTTTVPGATLAPELGGSTATFTPPRNLCAAEAPFEVSLVADDGPLTSAPATYTLIVEGWGPPNPAFPAGAATTQPSGTVALYAAVGGHPCDGTAGLPAPVTDWRILSSEVPGATLVAGDVPVSGTVTAAEIGLSAPECTQGTVILGATQRGGDAAGFAAEEASLTVSIETTLAPVETAAVSVSAEYDAGAFRVTGAVDTDLNCEASRSLTAEVSVLSAGTALGSSAVISVPGTYDLPVQIGCGGGALEVVAEVVDADGGRSQRFSQPFTAPVLPAAVGTLEGEVLLASCGAGAQGEVSSRFEPGQCPTSALTWTQLDGPALAEPTLTGTTVALQTQSTGLDGLIGETVTLQVDANAGEGNTATAVHTLVIAPASPFVALEQRASEPIAEEGSGLRMSVVARNTSACAVGDVTLVQQLEGGSYLPGTARIDGVQVEATVDGDTLTIPAVAFAANEAKTMTYSVRPRLLGSFRPTGQAYVKGFAVSEPSSLALPAGGCACGSAPGGAVALAALLLLRFRRRSGSNRGRCG